jgi:hypothetical protein
MNTQIWDALERAIVLAVNSHQGQRDKAGLPYMLHLLRVMNSVSDPIAKQAAVLHDYIEDVGGSEAELRKNQISDEAVQAILLLTHVKGSSYAEYVVKISEHSIAKQVKLADLEDNSRVGRVIYRAKYAQADARRMQKYTLSHQFLSGTIEEAEYRERMVGLE